MKASASLLSTFSVPSGAAARTCSDIANLGVRRNHAREDVGLEVHEDAHQDGQGERVEEHVTKNSAFLSLLPGGDTGHDDALGVNHLPHDAAGAVGRGGENGVEAERLGADF